jgi:hypothetical protein
MAEESRDNLDDAPPPARLHAAAAGQTPESGLGEAAVPSGSSSTAGGVKREASAVDTADTDGDDARQKKKKKTGPGSRGVANLTPEQLAKKRANGKCHTFSYHQTFQVSVPIFVYGSFACYSRQFVLGNTRNK